MIKGKLCKIGMVLLLVVASMVIGMLFTSIRTTAISSESFEAQPLEDYQIQNLDELN